MDNFFLINDTHRDEGGNKFGGFKKGDLVLFGFTSSLRDRLPWMPEVFNSHVKSGITWSMKEIGLVATGGSQIVWGNGTYKERYNEFFYDYLKHWVTNLYDETYLEREPLEKLCKEKQLFSVQFHPESSPGPHDSRYLFEEFIHMMSEKVHA